MELDVNMIPGTSLASSGGPEAEWWPAAEIHPWPDVPLS